MPTDKLLPYGHQVVDDDDIAAVVAALRSDYLTTGPRVEAFEQAFAAEVEAAHAVCCSSGTAALHLAAIALGLQPGDWLVVPTMTFLATANVARLVGADVQFADVDPETGMMTAETLAQSLNQARRSHRRVKAVSVVHLAGRTAPLPAIAAIAQSDGLPIVEDACHALGSTYSAGSGITAKIGDGRYGAVAAFSFHPVKTITTGEGGMATTSDEALANHMRLARNHGMVRNPAAFGDRAAAMETDGALNAWYYEMHEPGLNYRLPDILCSLGLSQLGKLGRFVERRRTLARLYDRAIAPLAPLVRIVPPVEGCNPALHLYVVLIDFQAAGKTRGQVMTELRARGIGTQVHYIPVHQQPYYRSRYGAIPLPGAEAYYSRCLSLPLFPAMNDGDINRVTRALAEILGLS